MADHSRGGTFNVFSQLIMQISNAIDSLTIQNNNLNPCVQILRIKISILFFLYEDGK